MADEWGESLKIRLFGSSHADCVGAEVYGIPAGLRFTRAELSREMSRRAPGSSLTSPRREPDEVFFDCGVSEDASGNCVTDGGLLVLRIPNRDADLRPYEKMSYYRPSHGDYTYSVRYPGRPDNRPSGRMTAPLVALGVVLGASLPVSLGSHILRLGDFTDEAFPLEPDEALLSRLRAERFPAVAQGGSREIERRIAAAREQGDSLGGMLETCVTGLPVGLGEPFFHSVEGVVSSLLYSIPGVKAVSFGAGEELARMKGSEANDPFILKDGQIRTASNRSGGVQGGLSNGMPLLVRVTLKPTPSIALPQRTVGFDGQETKACISGRHDPCILVRAIPVVEACLRIALFDLRQSFSDAANQPDLAQIRAEISRSDDELVRALKRRSEAVSKVGTLKAAKGLPVRDEAREEEETARILDTYFPDASEEDRGDVRELMTILYRMARRAQGEQKGGSDEDR